MSIATQIQRIEDNIANSYTALAEKGATMPTNKNSDNLASTINTIGGGSASDEVLKGIVEATATEIVLPDNIEKIANGFFRNNSTGHPYYGKPITSLTANGVKEVGSYIISGQKDNLLEINMPNLETIANNGLSTGVNTFIYPCVAQKIKLGKLKSVGDSAFTGLFNPKTKYNQEVEMSFDNCVIGTNAFKYYNLYAFDGTGIKSIGTQPFSYCGNDFHKIWLPKTIETISATDTTNGRLISFYNTHVTNSYITIYTDVASADEVPSGWGAGWNSPTANVTTVYGATYEDFLNAEV